MIAWASCISQDSHATNFFSRLFAGKPDQSEINVRVHGYINQVYTCLTTLQLDSAKIYLDSISLYADQVTEAYLLGSYYNYYATYCSLKQQEAEAHDYYYKAIAYYESTEHTYILIAIYHNLAVSYIQKKDTEHLKQILDKMLPLVSPGTNTYNWLNTCELLSFYYECLYEKDNRHTAFLDSAICYCRRVITMYETHTDPVIQPSEIANTYLHYVSTSLKKGSYDMDTIASCLRKADDLMMVRDTSQQINRLWLEGEIHYQQGHYATAKQHFLAQKALMDVWSPQKEYSIYVDVCDRLGDIAEMQGDYRSALAYQQQKAECLTHIHDAQRYEVIRELETRYEVSRKEQAIDQLTTANNFRKMINILALFLLLSGITAFAFVIRWIRQKRKTVIAQLKLIRMEKDNAMLLVQLKEKELNDTISEKCVALVDNYFKDEQIAGMDQELQALRQDQQQLNLRIRSYVEAQEKTQAADLSFATQDAMNTSLIREVYDLISKRMDNALPEKQEYADRLAATTDRFFTSLREQSPEVLSALNLKYALCFRIDMKNEHIAHCFSVEPSSVRMTRHRLKTTLHVEKGMDVGRFLRMIGE